MAGGVMVPIAPGKPRHYEGHVTFYLIAASLVASSGGLIFGYDLGISGGVSSMDDFLEKFFPSVYTKEEAQATDNYCRFISQTLQLFTSSLYLAGAGASFFASALNRRSGRKPTIFFGGVSFLTGAILNGAAQNLIMLVIGRILLGVAIGFAAQAVPLYLSEMAIPKWRGLLNITFQSATTIGIFVANLINYYMGKVTPYGWRISLGLAVFPALMLTIGGLFLPDTPNSLVERGKLSEGRRILEKVRGVKNVDVEFEDLVEASNMSKTVKSPWRNLLKRQYRPQLVMAICIPAFQQLGGVNVFNFYAPVLFKSIGFGANAALFSAVILGVVKVCSTWLSMIVVDRWGRRFLFFQGGIQMFLCQAAVGTILAAKMGDHNTLSPTLSVLVVVFVCGFMAGFDWSWGPLAWLVPSEIFPLEIRPAAQALTVTVNFLFTFLIGQIFLTLLCNLKSGTFFFFAGWIAIMTVFVALLLPETKNVPLDEMVVIWRRHWFWRRFVCYEACDQAFNGYH
ncbi:unnamed protein product [Calypogeia fissa]